MHAARKIVRASRRTVKYRGRRYAVCGLSERRGVRAERAESPMLVWMSSVACLALFLCGACVLRFTPLPVAVQHHGAVAARYTIDDFANLSR